MKKVWKKPKVMEFITCTNCNFKVRDDVNCLVCGKELHPYSIDHFEQKSREEEE